MGNATAETLYRIAGRKAAAGHGWDALNAQLAADALLIAAEMEKNPQALLDIGPLRSLELPDAGLAGAAATFRRQLLKGLDGWGISGTVEAALPAITLSDAALNPNGAGAFAEEWLRGRTLRGFVSAETARARRFAALADRLYAAGEYQAAARSAQAADRASVGVHYGAEAAALGDTGLAALRTGMLLAEDALEAEGPQDGTAEAGRQTRRIHDAVNLIGKPIHWESISYLS